MAERAKHIAEQADLVAAAAKERQQLVHIKRQLSALEAAAAQLKNDNSQLEAQSTVSEKRRESEVSYSDLDPFLHCVSVLNSRN